MEIVFIRLFTIGEGKRGLSKARPIVNPSITGSSLFDPVKGRARLLSFAFCFGFGEADAKGE